MKFAPRLTLAGLLLLAAGASFIVLKTPEPDLSKSSEKRDSASPRPSLFADETRIRAFCGDCHAFPDPGTFPRDAWFAEVEQGFRFYRDSGRSDLNVPPQGQVVKYFRSRAPQTLELAPPDQSNEMISAVQFVRQPIQGPDQPAKPSVSHLAWHPQESNRIGQLLLTDMGSSQVCAISLENREVAFENIGQGNHPAHVERIDLNNDNQEEFLVAGLGSFLPEDHDRGNVLLIGPDGSQSGLDPLVLARSMGRVADVQPGDFTGDGRTDLLVAEFGWRSTGAIRLLVQTNRSERGFPVFDEQLIDNRHGTIHVPTIDINNDGHLDFVALVSQEFEQVDAFLNRGDGTFDTQTVFRGGDPSFGSSGIQLVDIDADGDTDVLYTNGDTLDSFFIKPFHGIRWLENEGRYPFTDRLLHTMPGACRALAGDLDSDGDQDIVACAYIPTKLRQSLKNPHYDSVIWLEQTSQGKFERHSIERTDTVHFALELGDFDGDERLDIAVGNHLDSGRDNAPWLTVWWNQPQSLAQNVRRNRP